MSAIVPFLSMTGLSREVAQRFSLMGVCETAATNNLICYWASKEVIKAFTLSTKTVSVKN